MDDIEKSLKKFNDRERKKVKFILKILRSGWPWKGLHVEKLTSTDKIFRVRKSKIRVVFELKDRGSINILKIERKSDDTYKNL